MTKKIIALLLICLILTGCGQAVVSPTGSSSAATENTLVGATEGGTTAATEAVTPTDGPVEDTQPPATENTGTETVTPLSYWTPICNEYISMFSSVSSSEAFTTIPLGAKVGLLDWESRYAYVEYKGQKGYVYSNCLKPYESTYFADKLKVLTPTNMYSYEQMQTDMKKLQALYPQLISISTIGKTGLNRDIPVMIIGNLNAKYHVLVQGAMHGREHFTAWVAMAMADYMLMQNKLASDVCYHIIPMSNPDGVIISQTGKLGEEQWIVYEMDLDLGYTTLGEKAYATQWKANGTGVDLNRNFLSGWDPSDERSEVSSEKYRGCEPFSASEAAALRDYTTARTFHATISLHSHGSVLYYKYGTRQPVNNQSYSLAQAVYGITGYVPTSYDNTTGAGYKDWAMDALGIPSLTVEIGSNYTPLSQNEIYNTFDRCKEMLPTIYKWLTKN